MNIVQYIFEMYNQLRRQTELRDEQRRTNVIYPRTEYDEREDKEEYQRALVAGELNEMRGLHIAYHNRIIVATARSEIGLARNIIDQGLEGKCLLVKVGAGPIELGF